MDGGGESDTKYKLNLFYSCWLKVILTERKLNIIRLNIVVAKGLICVVGFVFKSDH